MNRFKVLVAVLILFFTISAISQSESRYVTVGDTSINLADVDLEKGMEILKKEFRVDTAISSPTKYLVTVRVFSGTVSENYAVVYDTIKFFNKSKYGSHYSCVKYYDEKNTMLFEKYYNNLRVSHLYISSSGEVVVIEVGNIDTLDVWFYSGDGEPIKKYPNHYERLYSGSKNNYFIISTSNELRGANNFDCIDKSGKIEKVSFDLGFFKGIKFSPEEGYYLVRLDKDQILYDRHHTQIWKLPVNKGFIAFLDDNKYSLYHPPIKSIEIKEILTHKLKYVIDSVFYNSHSLPIYGNNSIDGTVYVFGISDSLFIYNFYNSNGELLQTKTAPFIRVVGSPYKVIKAGDEFLIKPKETN